MNLERNEQISRFIMGMSIGIWMLLMIVIYLLSMFIDVNIPDYVYGILIVLLMIITFIWVIFAIKTGKIFSDNKVDKSK